jgi:hypothetical protein
VSDLPRYNLARIETQRDHIHSMLSSHYGGQTIGPEIFPDFLTRVRGLLPKAVGENAAFESCRSLLGKVFTPAESLHFAWRLAGNGTTLKEGRPVLPWAVQRSDEWVPAQVLRAMLTKNYRDQRGVDYTFRIIAGTPAGMRITQFFKPPVVRLVANTLGFSRGNYPYRNSRELVGLRCYLFIERERSEKAPGFFQVECPGSLVKWNRDQVLKMRARIIPCPQNFMHPCYRCAVGYNDCPAGTHRLTYTKGFCTLCGQSEAVFDPEDVSVYCIDCTFKERMKHAT